MTDNEDEHDDWIDEFWSLVQNILLAVGTCAAIAGLAGIVYGLGAEMSYTIALPRATVQQALAALEDWWGSFPDFRSLHDKVAIAALRTALEQQAEPIPTHRINSWGHCGVCRHDRIPGEGCARQECPDSPQQQAEPVHGDIRALKYRIHELEGEVLGYKRMLDGAEAASQPQQQAEPVAQSDLVKRLRETASKGVSVWGNLQMEAAREIEILRAERDCYASAMDKMLAASRAEPVGWKPIETAPKDEIVLLCLPLIGNIREGDRRVYEGRWHEAQATWTSVNGFLLFGAATNWMPLPQPPITAHGIKEGT